MIQVMARWLRSLAVRGRQKYSLILIWKTSLGPEAEDASARHIRTFTLSLQGDSALIRWID